MPPQRSAVPASAIVITRAASKAPSCVAKLERRGAMPISLPLVSFVAPQDYAPSMRPLPIGKNSIG